MSVAFTYYVFNSLYTVSQLVHLCRAFFLFFGQIFSFYFLPFSRAGRTQIVRKTNILKINKQLAGRGALRYDGICIESRQKYQELYFRNIFKITKRMRWRLCRCCCCCCDALLRLSGNGKYIKILKSVFMPSITSGNYINATTTKNIQYITFEFDKQISNWEM